MRFVCFRYNKHTHIGIWCNGSTIDFDSISLCSNHSIPAISNSKSKIVFKGVVIAKLKKWDMVTDTNLYLLNHKLPMIEPELTYDKYYDGHFVGKATCSKDDNFDLEIGMRIARNRALHKYYYEKCLLMIKMTNIWKTRISCLEKYGLHMEDKLFKIFDGLKEDKV